jgi:competence protein ComEC
LAALAAACAGQGRRFAHWAPVAIGLGAQLYFLSPVEPPLWTAGVAAAGAALVLRAALRRSLAALALAGAVAGVVLGFAAATVRAAAVAAPRLPAPFEAVVEGRVRTVDQSASGRLRLTLDRPRIWGLPAAATPARVRVTLGARAAPVAPGTWVSVRAALSAPAGPAEPGGFDFARAAWFDRLGGVGVARSALATIEGPGPTGPGDAAALALARAQFALSEGLRAALPGETGAFAAALTAGDRRGLPPEALEALRVSGLAHLLSISGLHMAVVCGLVFWTVRLGLVAVPGLALRRPVKKWAAVAALAAGGAYLALSGAAAPTERAFVMAACALGAVLADRPAVTMRAVALAATLILLRAPESLLDAGFQMSFAATVALVGAYEAGRGLLAPGPGARRAALRFAGGMVATSLIAGLATAPFAAFHFQRASVWSLPANLVGVPAISFAAAPALVAAAVAAPFGLEAAPLAVAGAAIDWTLAAARQVAALPGAEAPLAAAAPAALWAATAGGLWLCLWRGPLRLGGLAGLAAAAALWGGAPRPAALIGAAGAPVAVAGPQGSAVAGAGRDAFLAGVWLRRDGDLADPEEAAARPGIFLRDGWRTATAEGVTLLAPAGRDPPDPAAARAACGAGVVAVMPEGWRRPEGGCVVVDAADLRRRGPLAIHAGPGGPVLRWAGDAGAGRPWGAVVAE